VLSTDQTIHSWSVGPVASTSNGLNLAGVTGHNNKSGSMFHNLDFMMHALLTSEHIKSPIYGSTKFFACIIVVLHLLTFKVLLC